ncbi:hypothetical protein SeLEV6574_g08264, partial [Synchytrium endobioticum]
FVKISMYLELRLPKAYDSLLDDLKSLYLRHTEPSVLNEATKTLVYFAGGSTQVTPPDATDSEKVKTRKQKMKRSTSAKGDNASGNNTEVSLNATCRDKIEELAEDVVVNQMQKYLVAAKQAIEDDDEISESMVSLLNAMKRFEHLYTFIDVSTFNILVGGDANGSQSSQNTSNTDTIFDMLTSVLDASLSVLTPATDADVSRVATRTIEACLRLLSEEAVWQILNAAETLVPGFWDELETMKDAPTVEPAQLAQILANSLPNRLHRIMNIVQAILAGGVGTQSMTWQFELPTRLVAFQVLCEVSSYTNSDAAFIIPQIAQRPSGDAQAHMAWLMLRVCELMTVSTRDFTSWSYQEVKSLVHYTLSLAAQIVKGVHHQWLDAVTCAPCIIAYYGVSAVYTADCRLRFFGPSWDQMVDWLLQVLVVEGMKIAIKEKSETMVKECEDVGPRVLVESLLKAIGLYFSRNVSGIDPAVSLGKLASKLLTQWSKLVDNFPQLKARLSRIISQLVRKGIDLTVKLMVQAIKPQVEDTEVPSAGGDPNPDDTLIFEPTHASIIVNKQKLQEPLSIHEANECWKTWIQLIADLWKAGWQLEFDGLFDDTLVYLEAQDIVVQEDDEAWQILEQLGKALNHESVRKTRGTKKGAATKRTRASKSTRRTKAKRKKEVSEGDDDGNGDALGDHGDHAGPDDVKRTPGSAARGRSLKGDRPKFERNVKRRRTDAYREDASEVSFTSGSNAVNRGDEASGVYKDEESASVVQENEGEGGSDGEGEVSDEEEEQEQETSADGAHGDYDDFENDDDEIKVINYDTPTRKNSNSRILSEEYVDDEDLASFNSSPEDVRRTAIRT